MDTLTARSRNRLVQNIHVLGAYIFNATTPEALASSRVHPELCRHMDDIQGTRVYVVGFAVSKFHSNGTTVARPLDDHSSSPSTFAGTATILEVYTSSADMESPVYTLETDGIQTLQNLMKSIGLHALVGRDTPIPDIHAQLDSLSTEPPTDAKDTPSRTDSLETLKSMLECHVRRMEGICNNACSACPHLVSTASVVDALRSAVKAYSSVLSQNRTGKYVRMADGSRKWMKMQDAERMLELPRSERR